jgi:hypothetical protein
MKKVSASFKFQLHLCVDDDDSDRSFVAVSDEFGEPVGCWTMLEGLRTFTEFSPMLPFDVVSQISREAAQLVAEGDS